MCAQVGVAVTGHVHALEHPGWVHDSAVSTLGEAQTKELVAACEKLAGAFGVKRKAVEAASKALWETLKADRTKLDEACPALTEHHEHGFWEHNELSPACQEALKAYWTSAHEAGKPYLAAVQEACKTFHTALTEFEEATKSIMAALQAGETEHGGPGSGASAPHGYGRG